MIIPQDKVFKIMKTIRKKDEFGNKHKGVRIVEVIAVDDVQAMIDDYFRPQYPASMDQAFKGIDDE